MPITYSASSNKITVTGYTLATPCNFTDVYNADKAGTLALHTRTGITTTDGANVAVTRALRPADNVVLGGANNDLYIVITNWSGTSASILITGTDAGGAAQTETIVVNANGTYQSTKYYKTVTHTRVTVFTGTSFDYSLDQGQWGVVWRDSTNQFQFDCLLDIGDGSTTTWFADTSKSIVTTLNTYFIKVTASATFRLGEVFDAANKLTRGGCRLSCPIASNTIIEISGSCKMELYSTMIDTVGVGCRLQMTNQSSNSNIHRIWNCTWKGHSPAATQGIANIDIYNTSIENATSGILSIGAQDKIKIGSQTTYGGFLASLPANTIIAGYDVYGVTSYDWLILWNPNMNLYFDDCKIHYHGDDGWIFMWSGSNNCPCYRRYSFNMRTIDSAMAAIANTKVKIWDLVNTLAENLNCNDDGYLGVDYGTASSGTTTTLVDSSKTWTVDGYKNKYVEITSGTGVGQIRTIASNTATVLTPAVDFVTAPDSTSKYYIYAVKLEHGIYQNSNTETMRTPHTMRLYKYGKTMQYSKFKTTEAIDWLITMNTDPYITQTTESTVAAYTGITVNHTAETITISTNHTLDEIYDYCQYDIIAATKQLNQTIATADGINFTSEYTFIVNTGITVTATGQKLTIATGETYTLTGTANFIGIIADSTKTRIPITLVGVEDGSRYRVEKSSDGTLIAEGTQSGTGDITRYYEHTTNINIDIIVRSSSGGTKYLPWRASGTLIDAAFNIVVGQIIDSIAN